MGIGDRDYMKDRPAGRRAPLGFPEIVPRRPQKSGMPGWAVLAVIACLGIAIWAGVSSQSGPTPYQEMLMRARAMMPQPKARPLGTLENTAGRLILADPGLTREAVAGGQLAREIPARAGKWQTDTVVLMTQTTPAEFVRPVELRAWAAEAGDPAQLPWEPSGSIEIHGTAAGIFHAPSFLDDAVIPAEFKWNHPPGYPAQKWHSACLEVCLGSSYSGTLPGAAVAAASRGLVNVLLAKDKDGTVTGVRLVLVQWDAPNLSIPEEWD